MPRRMSETPLWQWGLICIVAAVSANLLMDTLLGKPDLTTAGGRGSAAGRGAAVVIFIVAGVALCGYDVVKRLTGKGARRRKRRR